MIVAVALLQVAAKLQLPTEALFRLIIVASVKELQAASVDIPHDRADPQRPIRAGFMETVVQI